ncbi:MAG: hypothetical protein J4F36_13475 [Nitrosopumilaceae archaeon]|nr:hypothetical protein [Nitrosopumilaceae archaeon]
MQSKDRLLFGVMISLMVSMFVISNHEVFLILTGMFVIMSIVISIMLRGVNKDDEKQSYNNVQEKSK